VQKGLHGHLVITVHAGSIAARAGFGIYAPWWCLHSGPTYAHRLVAQRPGQDVVKVAGPSSLTALF